MEIALGGFAGALGLFGLFAGIALVVWVNNKAESDKRRLDLEKEQLKHAERLKALEVGQPLPDADIAFAHAERARWRSAAAIGIVVPLVMVGTAVGTTAIVLGEHTPGLHLPGLCTIWGVTGLVCLVVPLRSLKTLRPSETPSRRQKKVMPEKSASADGEEGVVSSTAVRDRLLDV